MGNQSDLRRPELRLTCPVKSTRRAKCVPCKATSSYCGRVQSLVHVRGFLHGREDREDSKQSLLSWFKEVEKAE